MRHEWIRSISHWSLVIGHVIASCSYCPAQTDTTKTSRTPTIIASPALADTAVRSPIRKELKAFQPSKNPWLAVGLSALAPGAGQIYNQNYWKVPIIWGLGGYYISQWADLHKKYKDFRTQYSASVNERPPSGDSRLLRLRDFYRDERDKFAWYLGALYFLNLVDAFVGANLYDFDVGPDLSVDGNLMPGVKASVKLKF